MAKRSQRRALPSTIYGCAIVALCIAVLFDGDVPKLWVSIVALVLGIAAGSLSMRYAPRRTWIGAIMLAVYLLVMAVLYGWSDVTGIASGAWLFGFPAGIFLGDGWIIAHEHRHRRPTYAWVVDGAGFSTGREASAAAGRALSELDGLDKGSEHAFLTLRRESECFEAAGDVSGRLVCHYNPNADDEFSWHVLSRAGVDSTVSVDVPMGEWSAAIPQSMVHDFALVSKALECFLKGDVWSVTGAEWLGGDDAAATRLSTP